MTEKMQAYLVQEVFSIARLAIIILVTLVPIAAFSLTIDLNLNGQDIRLIGEKANNYAGHAVAFCDVNGDGRDDIIIASPGYDYNGRNNCGIVYVVTASDTLPPAIDLSSEDPNIKRIIGPEATQSIGAELSTGNINGDAYSDIIWGQPGASPHGRILAGKVLVIFGTGSLPDTLDLAAAPAGTAAFLGANAYDKLGSSLAAADVNNDGFDDVLAGAPLASPPSGSSAGELFVMFGSSSLPPVTDMASLPPGITCIIGEHAADTFGNSCFGNDLDGDNFSDIIVGAPMASPSGRSTAGAAYIIKGGAVLPDTIDVLKDTTAVTRIFGSDAGSLLGTKVTGIDVTGGGFPDVAISAIDLSPNGKSKAGGVYLIPGPFSFPDTIDLAMPVPGSVLISGAEPNDHIGMALSAGDFNFDGKGDVVVTAPEASPAGRSGAGEVFVIFGRAQFQAQIDLGTSQSGITLVCGAEENDYAGGSVFAGDMNGDSYDDLIIGSRNASPLGRSFAGKADVILGNPAITPVQVAFYQAAFENGAALVRWELAGPKKPASFLVYKSPGGKGTELMSIPIDEIGPSRYMFADNAVTPGGDYRYKVVLGSENRELFTVSLHVPGVRSIFLYQNEPNPFSSSTSIPFSLPWQWRTLIRIYDVRGRLVARLDPGILGPGKHRVQWDGLGLDGSLAASGVYFIRLESRGLSACKKALKIR